ncbi:MAG: acyltransferase, partial [Nitrospirota bacterium]
MKEKHIIEIDSFRAFAILSVLLFHYFKHFYPGVTSFLLFGWTGVDLFFVISGFVMYLQFQRRYHREGVTEYGKYFWNRFLRIAPAYYVSLLAEIVFFHPDKFLSMNFFFHLTFTNIISYKVAFSIQPIYWTLAVEAQFYIFLILFGKIFLGKKGYLSLSVIVALSFIYRYIVSAVFGFSNTGVLLIDHLPGRFPEFCYGILIAKLYMKDDLWDCLTRRVLFTLPLFIVGLI